MYCVKCGNKLREEAKYCNKCGKKVKELEQVKAEKKAEYVKEEAPKSLLSNTAIVSMVFGVLIITIGLIYLLQAVV